MKITPISYISEMGKSVQIEYAKKGENLVIQLKPQNRVITTEEAMEKTEGSPVRKIMATMDKILPRKNVAVSDDTYIDIYLPKENFNFFTIVINKFYEFPTDCEYLKEKLISELKTITL